MNILIVDDEALARERLIRLISEIPHSHIVGEAVSGVDALAKIQALAPDIIFLDIQMPGMDGLEVARHLINMDNPPAVVFTTAYDAYALEAFSVNAVDYLLKPIKLDHVKKTLAKILRPYPEKWHQLNLQSEGVARTRRFLSIKNQQGIQLIPVQEVYFLRSKDKYIQVSSTLGEYWMESSLRELESEFSSSFIRIHRSCLVQIAYIQVLEKNAEGEYFIRLKNDQLQEVSRRHLPMLRQRMLTGS